MKIIDRFKNNFFSEEYFFSFYKNHIYIINYLDVIDFSDKKMLIKLVNFNVLIKGFNLKIIRKTKNEIDIFGTFSSMEIINE